MAINDPPPLVVQEREDAAATGLAAAADVEDGPAEQRADGHPVHFLDGCGEDLLGCAGGGAEGAVTEEEKEQTKNK